MQLKSIILATTIIAAGTSGAFAEETVRVASWGGAYQDALSKAFFQPAAQELGLALKEDTLNGLADIRLQVSGNAVKWDLAELGAEECARGTKEGLFEKLDYTIIKADGIDPSLVADDWIGITTYGVVLATNTAGKLGDKGPKTWAEFWDVAKFPGPRSLGNFPTETLTIAAMADGTPIDKVHPPELDKAFAKLAEIKPHISAWWQGGSQAVNLIKDGEVEMTSIWSGRASVLVKEGAPVSYTFDGGVLNADCMVIPKGATNKDAAMKFLAKIVSPEIQANLPKYISNGPVNAKAFETGKLTAEEMAQIVSSPENRKKMVLLDFKWWAEKLPEVEKRWQEFLQQ